MSDQAEKAISPGDFYGLDPAMGVSLAAPGYEQLAAVLRQAFDQAARGKGSDRHAGGQPFHLQPMQSISQLLDTDGGMAFQAIKKIHEARGLPTRERRVAELLGAINYIAGMVIFEESQGPAEILDNV